MRSNRRNRDTRATRDNRSFISPDDSIASTTGGTGSGAVSPPATQGKLDFSKPANSGLFDPIIGGV